MGLDQYAYTTSHAHRVAHETGANEEQLEAFEEGCEQLHYWRKHANLNQWMTDLYFQKDGGVSEFNCVKLFLDAEDIDALEKVVCEGALPHGEGFFWGKSTLEDKLLDLEFISKARKALKSGKEVYYYCWY
jgi:hypothetical protein